MLRKLQNEGFFVELVRDGAQGLKRIKDYRPDLVLLDIILPTLNGYEVLEQKGKDPAIASIPVIIISNSGQPVEISHVLALGVKDYLVKAQFDPEEVVTKVRQHLDSVKGPEKQYAANKPERSKGEGGGLPTLSGKKIMWVEDDVFLSEIIARKLKTEGCILIYSSEGEKALAEVESVMPDIILLDILLSGIDGFEILRRLKENPKVKGIPVILLSNLGQKSDIDKGERLGATRFLVKATVTLDEILMEIRQTIAKSSKR